MRLQADVVFTGGRAVSDRVVTIADGRITAVEPASPPTPPRPPTSSACPGRPSCPAP